VATSANDTARAAAGIMNGRRLSSRYCERIDLIPLIDRERQAMCPGLFNPDPLDPVPALSDRSGDP
jgi:hypothetical protein